MRNFKDSYLRKYQPHRGGKLETISSFTKELPVFFPCFLAVQDVRAKMLLFSVETKVKTTKYLHETLCKSYGFYLTNNESVLCTISPTHFDYYSSITIRTVASTLDLGQGRENDSPCAHLRFAAYRTDQKLDRTTEAVRKNIEAIFIELAT